ncbi:MAG: hypothetical protein L0Z70_03680 [Chloroflexi bacterium]|nr:hypothetical protein [Chloroflexota bacterium]
MKIGLIKAALHFLILALIFVTLAAGWIPARAQSGLPDSPEFGYGARLDPLGLEVELALNAASGVGLEWLGVDFDWARLWPDASGAPDLQRLDTMLTLAHERQLQVSLSITHPPAWAIGERGPDAQKTAGLVMLLAARYAGQLAALELFPAANTAQGWGAPADPQAYAEILHVAQAALTQSGGGPLLAAGGLVPLSATAQPGDMDDLQFLQSLYTAGATPSMPVVSLRLAPVYGEAMTAPGPGNHNVLRHYEEARLVMLTNGHADGLIWITGFAWPQEPAYSDPASQALWLSQAYPLMKSQLYLGVAFFDRLNPPDAGGGALGVTLISVENGATRLHPSLTTIGQIVTSQHAVANSSIQLVLTKKLTSGPGKQNMKPVQT